MLRPFINPHSLDDPVKLFNIRIVNLTIYPFDVIYIKGFPKKDARFSKIKNMPDPLSDDKEGKIKKKIWETL